jgi:3-deoxy-D-manno-octulosonate 8-phosphate phosphatase KdsC-like HAD superfamily phosphatase
MISDRLSRIRLFLTDVDGCLTDGGMYYSASGDELKRFCVYDGMGMVLLQKAGIHCGILTSETTDIVLHRARKLNLDYLYMGVGRQKDKTDVMCYHPAQGQAQQMPFMSKTDACLMICNQMGISLDEVCYVGDDINDAELLKAVGYAACPSTAMDSIKTIEGIHILNKGGGEGAVRELCDLILQAHVEHH